MQYFIEGSVVCNIESTEKYSAIHELLTKASVFRGIKDLSYFENVVTEREKKLSTGLGHGVAFAHGKTDAVDSLYIALGVSKKGIEYEALDSKPVHFLFIVANPVDGHLEYLKLISGLSRLLRHDDFRSRIINMTQSTDIEKEFRTALEAVKAKC
ncbi:MAG: PTS sugar transporter subunit IIA [Spirochaetales bacterium]|nr:PTS sugar transporter subunit IIA [Spirochaetales bacterium]